MTTDAPAASGFQRLHPLSPLLRSGIFVVAWAGWVINGSRDGIDGREIAVSGAVALVAGLLLGATSWWFTRYRVTADEIRVESGVLRRQSRRIRIERLQAVEVQQPLLARIVGMAELSLEVAGGDDSGVRLAFLPLSRAVELRRQLLDRGEVGSAVVDRETEVSRSSPLFTVAPGRLLASQFLRTGFLTAVIGALIGLAATSAGGEGVRAVLVVGAVLGVAGFVFTSFTSLYGFTVRESDQGLRIRHGMLGLRSQTVPVGRVQGVVLVEPLLWRLLHWVRVDVTVAGVRGSGSEDGRQVVSTLVPVAPRSQAIGLATTVLGTDPAAVLLREPPRRAAWLAPVTRRRLAVGVSPWLVVTRRGLLLRRTDAVRRTKIQSVRLVRGPVARLLGLASVRVDLTPGPVVALAAHRDESEAWRLVLELVDVPLR